MAKSMIEDPGARTLYLRVESKLGRRIEITRQYWRRIVTVKHPSISGKESEVERTLKDPHAIRRSKIDTQVFLYYRKYTVHYICVVVRHQNGKGFVITAYITNKIKEGEPIWPKINEK